VHKKMVKKKKETEKRPEFGGLGVVTLKRKKKKLWADGGPGLCTWWVVKGVFTNEAGTRSRAKKKAKKD